MLEKFKNYINSKLNHKWLFVMITMLITLIYSLLLGFSYDNIDYILNYSFRKLIFAMFMILFVEFWLTRDRNIDETIYNDRIATSIYIGAIIIGFSMA